MIHDKPITNVILSMYNAEWIRRTAW